MTNDRATLRLLAVLAAAPVLLLFALTGSSRAAEFAAVNGSGEGPEHALIEASQSTTHQFVAGEGFAGITCTTATFAATSATGVTTKLSLTPTYSGCEDSLGRTIDVSVNGCKYELHATEGSGETFTGDWTIACETGKAIEWKITSGESVICTVTVPAQKQTGKVHFLNMAGPPKDLTFEIQTESLKNTTAGGFFNCGVGNGEHTKGTYTGNTTMTAKNVFGEALSLSLL
jgi:hypothetical protein